MPMPRRPGFVVGMPALHQSDDCVVVPNFITFEPHSSIEDGFESLGQALAALEIGQQSADNVETLIQSHPLFKEARKEYNLLLKTFLPEFEIEVFDDMTGPDANQDLTSDSELSDALNTFVALTKRRKLKAQDFFRTLAQFLMEYERAVDELSTISANPVLRGSYLHEKINELKNTVKRKFGSKLEELQKECINKRRRANLPSNAKQIFSEWFRDHQDNPYPNDAEKQQLALQAGVSEAQVSNWFVNVRKRYWKSR